MKKLQAQKYLLLNKNNLAPKAKKKKKSTAWWVTRWKELIG